MRGIKFLFVSICCCCTIFMGVDAYSNGNNIMINTFDEQEIIENKLYIQPEQIHFLNKNIYITLQNELLSVPQLNCDDHGIYCFLEDLDSITDICRNGHKI